MPLVPRDPRALIVPDGRRAAMPDASQGAMRLLLLDSALAEVAAEMVEETSEADPVLIRFRTAEIEDTLAVLEAAQGCGCTQGRAGAGWFAWLPLGLVLLRRRRSLL